jgi:hypothetical protein
VLCRTVPDHRSEQKLANIGTHKYYLCPQSQRQPQLTALQHSTTARREAPVELAARLLWLEQLHLEQVLVCYKRQFQTKARNHEIVYREALSVYATAGGMAATESAAVPTVDYE